MKPKKIIDKIKKVLNLFGKDWVICESIITVDNRPIKASVSWYDHDPTITYDDLQDAEYIIKNNGCIVALRKNIELLKQFYKAAGYKIKETDLVKYIPNQFGCFGLI